MNQSRWRSRPLLLPLLCAVAAAAFVVVHYGDDGGFQRLLRPHAGALIGMLSVVLLRWVCATLKFYALSLRWGVPFGWRQAFILQWVGTCGAAITPAASGASPTCLWYLWRRGISGPNSMAAVAYVTALDAVLFSVTVPALLPSYVRIVGGGLPLGVVITALVLSFGALVFGFMLVGAPRTAVRWVGFILTPFPRFRRRALPPLLRAAAAIAELRRERLLFHGYMLLLTALEWLAIYSVLPLAAATLGLQTHWWGLTVVQHVVQVVAFVFPTPGGSGLFEAGLPMAAGALWPPEASASLILLWRFWSYGIYLILAAWLGSAFLAQALNAREQRREQAEESQKK